MNDLENLSWSDIRSDLMNPQEFKDKIKDKQEKWNNYKKYNPDRMIISRIKKLLAKNNQKLRILAIGATWCKDCSIQLPRMTKISEVFENFEFEFYILYGVMVDALGHSETKWHTEKSPPEATNPKFDLKAIPTFYIFNREGDLLDRIIEKPKKKETLEGELLFLLENS